MKSLKDYLAEVNKKFSYRVKVAGDFTKESYEAFEKMLTEFQLEEITEMKTTPIMKEMADFPGLKNEPMSFFEFTINYPASIPQLLEMAHRVGLDENKIQIMNKNYAESLDVEQELLNADIKTTPRLETEYPEDTKEHKDLSKAYSDSFLSLVKELDTRKYEIAK